MKTQHELDEMTLYLSQTLNGYEVIPANWGWHIHKGDRYCGYLEYQETRGWEGTAFNRLSKKVREQLKKFVLSNSSVLNEVMA